VTAPAKGATDVIARFAGENYRFIAPDALLASSVQADWLIVDEAAAIPGPLLEKLVRRFPVYCSPPPFRAMKGRAGAFTEILRPV
jgi:tRNA(Met) cytidine acetyltransferase